VQIKGCEFLFKGEIIAKIGWGHLKIFLRTTEPVELICRFKFVPGVGRGHYRENHIYMFLY
jgi:hypothetical protein